MVGLVWRRSMPGVIRVQIIIEVMVNTFRSFVRLFLKNDIIHIFGMLIGVFENPSLPMRGLKREFERKYVVYND